MPRAKSRYKKDPTHAPRSKAVTSPGLAAPPLGSGPGPLPASVPYGTLARLDAELATVLSDAGYTVHIRTARNGDRWFTCAFRTAQWPCHYVSLAFPHSFSVCSGLAALVEKIYQVEEGTLKPSPDKWNGKLKV